MQGTTNHTQISAYADEWGSHASYANFGQDTDEVTALDESLQKTQAHISIEKSLVKKGHFSLISNRLMKSMQLYDLAGKCIKFESVLDKQHEIDISCFKLGVYFVLVRFVNKKISSQTHKISIG